MAVGLTCFVSHLQTQNETLRGELESMVYSYMNNSNNNKEKVWFEFILIYFQFSFVLRYFDLCQKKSKA